MSLGFYSTFAKKVKNKDFGGTDIVQNQYVFNGYCELMF